MNNGGIEKYNNDTLKKFGKTSFHDLSKQQLEEYEREYSKLMDKYWNEEMINIIRDRYDATASMDDD